MNLPNKLTAIRIILSPIFLGALIMEYYLAALIIFAVASFTDYIDGNMARRNQTVTDFGKFLDPLADKMLTTSAFLGFIYLGIGYGITWITFIVLIREFLITSFRLVSAGKGKVIGANVWGKAKTVSQMAAIIVAIVGKYVVSFYETSKVVNSAIEIATNTTLWISTVLTVVSGVIYVFQNRQFIDPKK